MNPSRGQLASSCPAGGLSAAPLGFHEKEVIVKRAQLIGGIVLLVLAALIFLFLKTSASIPAAITLTVVGLVLVATARRRKSE